MKPSQVNFQQRKQRGNPEYKRALEALSLSLMQLPKLCVCFRHLVDLGNEIYNSYIIQDIEHIKKERKFNT